MVMIAKGAWEVAGDSDWFAVDLVAGRSYTLDFDGLGGEVYGVQGPSGHLFPLDVFASAGAPGHFTALATGTYWFAADSTLAGNYNPDQRGRRRLRRQSPHRWRVAWRAQCYRAGGGSD